MYLGAVCFSSNSLGTFYSLLSVNTTFAFRRPKPILIYSLSDIRTIQIEHITTLAVTFSIAFDLGRILGSLCDINVTSMAPKSDFKYCEVRNILLVLPKIHTDEITLFYSDKPRAKKTPLFALGLSIHYLIQNPNISAKLLIPTANWATLRATESFN